MTHAAGRLGLGQRDPQPSGAVRQAEHMPSSKLTNDEGEKRGRSDDIESLGEMMRVGRVEKNREAGCCAAGLVVLGSVSSSSSSCEQAAASWR